MVKTDRPDKISDTIVEISDYNYNTMLRNVFPIILPIHIRLEKDLRYQIRVRDDRFLVFGAYLLSEKITKIEDIDDWILFLIVGENSRHQSLQSLKRYGYPDISEVVRVVLLSREKVLHKK